MVVISKFFPQLPSSQSIRTPVPLFPHALSMSRSAVDATRFTATSPHAYSKPTAPRSATSNTISPPSATRSQPSTSHPTPGAPTPGTVAPNGAETPKQKVARLRAAHEAAKQRQISRWDTIVVRGRVWADRAHRFTAMGLIGCTGRMSLDVLSELLYRNDAKS